MMDIGPAESTNIWPWYGRCLSSVENVDNISELFIISLAERKLTTAKIEFEARKIA